MYTLDSVHCKDWLSNSVGTNWRYPSELCYNVYILNETTNFFNFPTRIPDSDPDSPASESRIAQLCYSLHCKTLIILLSQLLLAFLQADCDGVRDHLRDFSCMNTFNLVAPAASSKLCVYVMVEMMHISLIVNVMWIL